VITILSSLLGFFSAAFPDFLKLFQQAQDRKHELRILEMQMQQQAQGHTERMEAIGVQADISESRAIYKTYKTGIDWVDALNGTVRPVLAYAFFLLYAGVKLANIAIMADAGAVPATILGMVWTEEDQAIFAAIVSFYYGQRALSKARKGA
jgi:hypothetical protein